MTDELKAWAEEQAYERAKAEYMEKLDGIKTEIIDLANAYDYQQSFNHGLMRAVQIIDKYMAESEDKEQKE